MVEWKMKTGLSDTPEVEKSLKNIRIIELTEDNTSSLKLKYRSPTSSYYDLSIYREAGSWKIELTLKPLERTLERKDESNFFEPYINEPRVFTAELDGEQIGWIELGYDAWNNRMRVWEVLVKEEFRGKGVGTLLMDHAVKVAKEKGARMLVLETQTGNIPAINFYLKYGFKLIGFDAAAYSNNDIEKKEVRLEFGLEL